MLIEGETLKYWIDHFFGYGSWNSRFWFMGYEENGGDLPEETAEKFNYLYRLDRSESSSLCDIRDLYRNVAFRIDGKGAAKHKSLYDYRFGDKATLHGTWKNLTAFRHGYDGQELPDLLTYQRHSFALPQARSEALLSLFPLPAHHHAWYYAWLELPQFPFLKSRTQYYNYVYPDRMHQFLTNISVYKPEIVLMYGMDNVNLIKQSIQEYFPETKFKMFKAVGRLTPQHHRTTINGTELLITTQIPALKHNRVETGFDWYGFGKQVKENLT